MHSADPFFLFMHYTPFLNNLSLSSFNFPFFADNPPSPPHPTSAPFSLPRFGRFTSSLSHCLSPPSVPPLIFPSILLQPFVSYPSSLCPASLLTPPPPHPLNPALTASSHQVPVIQPQETNLEIQDKAHQTSSRSRVYFWTPPHIFTPTLLQPGPSVFFFPLPPSVCLTPSLLHFLLRRALLQSYGERLCSD